MFIVREIKFRYNLKDSIVHLLLIVLRIVLVKEIRI